MARWVDGWNLMVVGDAYRLLPVAEVLYACDNSWWQLHQECKGFTGDRWSCHEQDPNPREVHGNDKRDLAKAYGINLVRGREGHEFSTDPAFIRYGENAGFQALNLALLFGAMKIVLVGFDMRHVDGRAHFFGDHPDCLRNSPDDVYRKFAKIMDAAAQKLSSKVSIINATPGSALTAFEARDLESALQGGTDRVYCNGSEPHDAASGVGTR